MDTSFLMKKFPQKNIIRFSHLREPTLYPVKI